MPEPLVCFSRDRGVATITFNDPDRRNAMTQAMGESLAATIATLSQDESLRAVVLTGSGRAFSAGGDLDMIQSRADQGRSAPDGAHAAISRGMREFYGLFLRLRDLPCPSVAAINGAAIGAGLCVALACDLRIAADDARLGLNFTALGLHPGMGATWTLPRLVGPARAAELLYTSRSLTGAEAAAIGLVNRAVPHDEVSATARDLAHAIAANGPMAVRGVKRSLARSPWNELGPQLDLEADIQARCFATEDAQEGIAAARERRSPSFTGN
jgi:enoyl-CoA hydratase